MLLMGKAGPRNTLGSQECTENPELTRAWPWPVMEASKGSDWAQELPGAYRFVREENQGAG